jgi:hypothetical protein
MCLVFFRPNESAIGVGSDTYFDIGSGSAVRSNLTRLEKKPGTSHTLLRHVGGAIAQFDSLKGYKPSRPLPQVRTGIREASVTPSTVTSAR